MADPRGRRRAGRPPGERSPIEDLWDSRIYAIGNKGKRGNFPGFFGATGPPAVGTCAIRVPRRPIRHRFEGATLAFGRVLLSFLHTLISWWRAPPTVAPRRPQGDALAPSPVRSGRDAARARAVPRSLALDAVTRLLSDPWSPYPQRQPDGPRPRRPGVLRGGHVGLSLGVAPRAWGGGRAEDDRAGTRQRARPVRRARLEADGPLRRPPGHGAERRHDDRPVPPGRAGRQALRPRVVRREGRDDGDAARLRAACCRAAAGVGLGAVRRHGRRGVHSHRLGRPGEVPPRRRPGDRRRADAARPRRPAQGGGPVEDRHARRRVPQLDARAE